MTTLKKRFKDYFIGVKPTPIDFNENFEEIKYFYIKPGFLNVENQLDFEFLLKINETEYKIENSKDTFNSDGGTENEYKFYKVDNLSIRPIMRQRPFEIVPSDVRIKKNKKDNTAELLYKGKFYTMYKLPNAISENNIAQQLGEVVEVNQGDESPNYFTRIAKPVVHINRSSSNRSRSSSIRSSNRSSSNRSSRSSSRSGGKKTRKNKKNNKKHK